MVNGHTREDGGVSPIRYLCSKCGTLGAKPGLCPNCTRADNRRRNHKRRDSGRTTAAWQRLRLAAMHRDNTPVDAAGSSATDTR